jgi:two-component system, OmpR family, sensor kinase
MSVRARVANWPLAWKVPLLAAGLLIGVAFFISQIVLNRLESDQENNLRHLTSAYLDGLSTAVLRSTIHADVWETFDALDRARDRYAGLKVRFAIVALPDGRVLAASDPLKFPEQSPLPGAVERRFPPEDGLIIDTASGRAWLARSLREEGYSVGRILAEIDISELLGVRRQVLFTLVGVNVCLALGFAMIGSFALRRMLKPLSVLSGYVERVRAGRADPIPESKRRHISREFDLLFDRFNAMARALNEREELASHLADQEKYAVLGKLASGMAHEVNNPLGGLFNAVDTLRRHGNDGEVREATLNLLERGLTHIRNVVRSSLVTYRRGAADNFLRPLDVDDLRLLIEPEASRKRLQISWVNDLHGVSAVTVESVRQVTLNLLINACAATPVGGIVYLRAQATDSELTIDVGDQGPGLSDEIASYLVGDSDEAPRAGHGLGLWIVRRLVADEEGQIRFCQETGLSTLIRVTWPLRQVLRPPERVQGTAGIEAIHAQ